MHLLTPIQYCAFQNTLSTIFHMSESTTGLVDHLLAFSTAQLHTQQTGLRPAYFPVVRTTFGQPVLPSPHRILFGDEPIVPLDPHTHRPHYSPSKVCCFTTGAHREGIQAFVKAPGWNFHLLFLLALTAFRSLTSLVTSLAGTPLLLVRFYSFSLLSPSRSLFTVADHLFWLLSSPDSSGHCCRAHLSALFDTCYDPSRDICFD